MRALILAFFVISLAACFPPPAWEPGQSWLRVYAPDDLAWSMFEDGGALWERTGLEIQRVTSPKGADVEVYIEDIGAANAEVEYRPGFGGWEYVVNIHPRNAARMFSGDDKEVAYAIATVGHEVGHLLGIWEHLPVGSGALMAPSCESLVPTWADYTALPFTLRE